MLILQQQSNCVVAINRMHLFIQCYVTEYQVSIQFEYNRWTYDGRNIYRTMASMNNPVIKNSTISVLTHVKNHNALCTDDHPFITGSIYIVKHGIITF